MLIVFALIICFLLIKNFKSIVTDYLRIYNPLFKQWEYLLYFIVVVAFL
jgi:hypothetical protein